MHQVTLRQNLIHHLRAGRYSRAASILNVFLGELEPLLQSGKIELSRFKPYLEYLLNLQESQDWVGMADHLEFAWSFGAEPLAREKRDE